VLEWTGEERHCASRVYFPFQFGYLTTFDKLLLICGTENTLTSVVELEKCEYQFTGTTPALCVLPRKEKKSSGREEREEL
jgi:hypothetical protein